MSFARLAPSTSFFDKVQPYERTPSIRTYCHCGQETRQSSLRPHPQFSPSLCSHSAHLHSPFVIPALDVTAQYISSSRPERPRQNTQTRAGGTGIRSGIRGRGTRQSLRQASSSADHQSLSRSDLNGLTYYFPEDHAVSNQPDPPAPAWPTESGLTEPEARQLCRRALWNSTVGLGCGSLLAGVMEQTLEMCVLDQQLKDDRAWLGATVPMLENECERRVMEYVGRTEELHSILTFLRCPSLCSGNGQCNERGCMCFPGFGSYDCSQVSGEYRDGVCHKKKNRRKSDSELMM